MVLFPRWLMKVEKLEADVEIVEEVKGDGGYTA